jgi:predicted RNA-binding Zn ribbon-like protein
MSQIMFGHDLLPSLGFAVGLVNTSEKRWGYENLNSTEDLVRLGLDNAISYSPDGTKNEIIAMRKLRERLDEAATTKDLGKRFEIINDLFFNASAIPQIVTHDGPSEADGIPHFHYTMEDAPYVSHLMAVNAYALARLTIMGEFERLRVCEGDDCSKLFIDVSRNGMRRYCDSQTCGNRLHAARYRARKTAEEANSVVHAI